MEKLGLQMLLSRLKTPGTARGYRWRRGGLLSLIIFLLVATGGQPGKLGAAGIAREDRNGISTSGTGEPQRQPAVFDAVYDHFLQRFKPLRADVARRRYLVAEVMTAAIQNRVDPDLLFALVAVESSFNSSAVSSRGARGLGQVMFATGRAVAPRIVRGPEDLYSVPRNLQFTALYLGRLLVEQDGELGAALTAYHTGSASGHPSRRETTDYVDRVCRAFAFLKTQREYRRLMAAVPGDTGTVRN